MMRRGLSLAAAGVLLVSGAAAGGAQEQGFAAAIRLAMDKMHNGMTVAPSGDVDRDFATMMVAHHQGAIDMAEAELQYGKDQRLRRLAQGIIVEQQQEIAVMDAVLAERTVRDRRLEPGSAR